MSDKHIGIYASEYDLTQAVNNEEIKNPYIALAANSLDYNTKTPAPGPVTSNNKIFYTSTDGTIIVPANTTGWTENIVSNTNVEGVGCITFDADITAVPVNAFKGKTKLVSMILPDGITNVGNYAFTGCTSLSAITLSSGLTTIGQQVFGKCTSLTSITFPEGISIIPSGICSGCTSLVEVNLPSSCTKIDGGAFYGCSSLASINLPSGLTTINTSAFERCSSLASINIPASVNNLSARAFRRCSSLSAITVAQENTIYDSRNNCNAIVNTSANTIMQGSKTTTIPSTVTDLSGYSFYYMDLVQITVPSSVTSIGTYAFGECSGLTTFNYEGTMAQWGSVVLGSDWNKNCPFTVVHCSDGDLSLYVEIHYTSTDGNVVNPENPSFSVRSNTYSGGEGIISCNGVPTVIDGFANKNTLASIVLPDTILKISDGAFYNCQALSSVTIQSGVSEIGQSAFYNCLPLSSVTIPDSVSYISSTAFAGCTSLASVTIPSGVTVINTKVFQGCTALSSVTISESVTKIASEAFDGCSALSSLTIPASMQEIENYAFSSSGLSDFHYSGTMAQWGSVTLGENWNGGTAITVIHCSDGDITL